MVFQSYALFPHLSVWDNIAFGLRRESKDKAAIAARVDEMLRLTRLEGGLLLLTWVVEAPRIEEVLAGETIEASARALVAAANDCGGPDNVTVALAWLS